MTDGDDMSLTTEELIQQSVLAENKGDMFEAKRLLDQAVKQDPQNPWVAAMLTVPGGLDPGEQPFPYSKRWQIFALIVGLMIGLSAEALLGLSFMSIYGLSGGLIGGQLNVSDILPWDRMAQFWSVVVAVVFFWVIAGAILAQISRLANKPALGMIADLINKLGFGLFLGAMIGLIFTMIFTMMV